MEVTIEAMNVIIARFENRKFFGKYNIDDYGPHHGLKYPEMKYHTSWDWLMPVVEKIRGMGYHIEITISVDCSVEIIKLLGDPEKDVLRIIAYSTPLNAVYTAVYQFIQWYNSQHKQQ